MVRSMRPLFAAGLVLAAAGCEERHHEQILKGWLTRSLLGLSEERDPKGETAVARAAALKELGRLSSRARGVLAAEPQGGPVERLNQLLFHEERFKRVVKDPPPESMLLAQVLQRKEGSCLGLSGLYLALGEQLGLPIRGVLVPGHFFVRYRGPGGARGVELLRQGEQMPPSWYQKKYGPPAGHGLYLRDLSPRQTLAVFRYNLANEHRLAGRTHEAITLYQRVVAELPLFAEAQANLGLCYHRLGRATAARRAYELARESHPALPGLAQNLEALNKDQKKKRSPMSVSALSLARKLAAIEAFTPAGCERALGLTLRQDPGRAIQFWGDDPPAPVATVDVRIGKTGGVVVINLDGAADLRALTKEAEGLGLGTPHVISPPILIPGKPLPREPVRRWSSEHTIDQQSIAFSFEQVGKLKRLVSISRKF